MTEPVSVPRFDQVCVGDPLPARRFPLRRVDLVRYAGAGGDFNVIHWNDRAATAVGLPSVIAHGMLTMATAGRLVSDWAGDPGAVIELSTRFVRPVPVPDDEDGATIEISGVIAVKDEAARTVRVDLLATFQDQKVLGKAQALVRLP